MDADRSLLGDVMMFKMRISTSLLLQDSPSLLAHDVTLSRPDDRLKADDTRRTEVELGATPATSPSTLTNSPWPWTTGSEVPLASDTGAFLAPTAHLLSGLSRRFQDQPGDLVGMRDQ
jgi:hypothetical protein